MFRVCTSHRERKAQRPAESRHSASYAIPSSTVSGAVLSYDLCTFLLGWRSQLYGPVGWLLTGLLAGLLSKDDGAELTFNGSDGAAAAAAAELRHRPFGARRLRRAGALEQRVPARHTSVFVDGYHRLEERRHRHPVGRQLETCNIEHEARVRRCVVGGDRREVACPRLAERRAQERDDEVRRARGGAGANDDLAKLVDAAAARRGRADLTVRLAR
eukprot:5038767-Pleurochrysis_carterae.AAC.3